MDTAISDWLTAKAKFQPGAPALEAPGRGPLSYENLRLLMKQTVSKLNECGVGRGDRVAVVLPNGPEMASAFLAVSAGATCAPLNPAYGFEECIYYLKDLSAKALIVQEGIPHAAEEAAASLGVSLLRLHAESEREAGRFHLTGGPRPLAPPGGWAAADDVALVLHTSGTTSKPKIVPLTHANLLTSAENIQRTLLLTPRDRCLNIMPLFHIHGLVGALLSSLQAGACIVCTEGFRAPKFFSWMEETRPTWYSAVPTMHQAILARATVEGADPAGYGLRLIRSSSASLPPQVMTQLESVFQSPVIESYGMTEAAHQMASNPLPPAPRKPGSVGLPAGPEVAVMDENGALLAAGATGEVVIRGPNVTHGYEAGADVNRKAFTNGWFRTGDQGYFDADGYLFLTGRLKEIINRGGEKISPREIDEVLLDHPCVAQAVTFAVPHAQLGEEVGAAVVLRDGGEVTGRELQSFVGERLADFKIPRVVRILDEIPKGPTGKVQRIGLAERLGIEPMDASAESGRPSRKLPSTPTEEQLAAIWSEVLGIPSPEVDAGFFALGGDSMLLTQVLSRVEGAMNVSLPLVELLDGPAIEEMAAIVDRMAGDGLAASSRHAGLIPIQPDGDRIPLYCAGEGGVNLVSTAYLARELGNDQPVFGFPPVNPSISGEADGVERIASLSIEQMRSHRPNGPYFLAGICFGGIVVHEMARQLKQQGETVGMLAMIVCPNPVWQESLSLPDRWRARVVHVASRLKYQWRLMGDFTASEKVRHIRRFVNSRTRRLARSVRRGNGNADSRVTDAVHQTRREIAARGWKPSRYDGPAVLFRDPAPRAADIDDPQMGWAGLIQEPVSVFDLPEQVAVNLWTEANVRFIAAQLRRELDARANNSGGFKRSSRAGA